MSDIHYSGIPVPQLVWTSRQIDLQKYEYFDWWRVIPRYRNPKFWRILPRIHWQQFVAITNRPSPTLDLIFFFSLHQNLGTLYGDGHLLFSIAFCFLYGGLTSPFSAKELPSTFCCIYGCSLSAACNKFWQTHQANVTHTIEPWALLTTKINLF